LRSSPIENPSSAVLEVRRSFGLSNAPAVAYAVAKTITLDGSVELDIDVEDTPYLCLWVTTAEAGAMVDVFVEMIGDLKYLEHTSTIDLSTAGAKGLINLPPELSVGSVVFQPHQPITTAEVGIYEHSCGISEGMVMVADSPLDESVTTLDVQGVAQVSAHCTTIQAGLKVDLWAYFSGYPDYQ
jgi:hypothetical protein